MNITLYSFPGISREDTPVFSSLTAQLTFFEGLTHDTIDTGFYPPFFKNSIKLDISDYNLTTTSWNYCRIQFWDKGDAYSRYFYYFVTNKKYINEDIVEIDLEMDTIQTYMFYATWVSAKLDRLSIIRWDSEFNINRDYIRENVSNNSFTTISEYIKYNTDYYNWLYVAKLTQDPDAGGSAPQAVQIGVGTAGTNYEYEYSSNYNYFCTFRYAANASSGSTNIVDPNLLLNGVGVLPQCVDLYMIPFQCLIGVYISTPGTISGLGVSNTWYARRVLETGSSSYVIWNQGGIYRSLVNTVTYTFPSLKTPAWFSLGGEFDSFFCPQLLDNNYTRLVFGDPSVSTEYPLYNLVRNRVYFSYWADLGSGYRYYNIYANTGEFDNNRYSTIVCNSSTLSIDLKNDPWETYIANNKATLSGALITSSMGLTTSAMGIGASRSPYGEVAFAQSVGSTANKIGGYFINQANLQHAPYTVKQTGTIGGEVISGNAIISARLWYCDDYDNCAKFFEMYGYKVSMHTTTPLYTIQNRYLYDVVKTDYLNVLLAGDEQSRDDFIQRFNNGVRLWHTVYNGHTRTTTLNCKKSPYNCEMGNCLKYNNIEKWKYDELVG